MTTGDLFAGLIVAVIWLVPTILIFRWLKRRGVRKEERKREKEAERGLALAREQVAAEKHLEELMRKK